MLTAARRLITRMAIQVLALLCLIGVVDAADVRRQQLDKGQPILGLPDASQAGNGRSVTDSGSGDGGQDSALETAFGRRAGKQLRLFGYDAFTRGGATAAPAFGT